MVRRGGGVLIGTGRMLSGTRRAGREQNVVRSRAARGGGDSPCLQLFILTWLLIFKTVVITFEYEKFGAYKPDKEEAEREGFEGQVNAGDDGEAEENKDH